MVAQQPQEEDKEDSGEKMVAWGPEGRRKGHWPRKVKKETAARQKKKETMAKTEEEGDSRQNRRRRSWPRQKKTAGRRYSKWEVARGGEREVAAWNRRQPGETWLNDDVNPILNATRKVVQMPL